VVRVFLAKPLPVVPDANHNLARRTQGTARVSKAETIMQDTTLDFALILALGWRGILFPHIRGTYTARGEFLPLPKQTGMRLLFARSRSDLLNHIQEHGCQIVVECCRCVL